MAKSSVISDNTTITKTKHIEPELYKVILLNDDYTPMDFVVQVLVSIFQHSVEIATEIMMEIHEKGKGIAGIYPYEIAEQKAFETFEVSRKYEFPLNVKVVK